MSLVRDRSYRLIKKTELLGRTISIQTESDFWLLLLYFGRNQTTVENTAPLHANFPTIARAKMLIFSKFQRGLLSQKRLDELTENVSILSP